MNKVQILAIGRNPEIMEKVLQRINLNDRLEAVGATDDEKAIELFQQRRFDVVLLGGGVPDESERKLVTIFTYQNPLIKIVQHFGGNNGFIIGEIEAAMESSQAGNFQVVDNPFQR